MQTLRSAVCALLFASLAGCVNYSNTTTVPPISNGQSDKDWAFGYLGDLATQKYCPPGRRCFQGEYSAKAVADSSQGGRVRFENSLFSPAGQEIGAENAPTAQPVPEFDENQPGGGMPEGDAAPLDGGPNDQGGESQPATRRQSNEEDQSLQQRCDQIQRANPEYNVQCN